MSSCNNILAYIERISACNAKVSHYEILLSDNKNYDAT